MTNDIEWAETLPPSCPPIDATRPNNDAFYRLVENIPPQDRDFWSQRKLYPAKNYNTTECMARACSIMSTLDSCDNIRKLPTHCNKKIVKIILPARAGLIKKTGKEPSHYSWWRLNNFDPVSICEFVDI